MKTLVIDVGGTHIKFLVSGRRVERKFVSGEHMTPGQMVKGVLAGAADWHWNRVAIGYPGPVVHGRIVREPFNLGRGWVGFDFNRALGAPTRILNDAAMQALGSYHGGRMLFLGLGTGLGSAMIVDGVLQPMELAHLPYKKGKTYEQYLGLAALRRSGKRKWLRHVKEVVEELRAALAAEYVVLGGGNARLIGKLPPGTELGDNRNAIRGGFRLWQGEGGEAVTGLSRRSPKPKRDRTSEPGL